VSALNNMSEHFAGTEVCPNVISYLHVNLPLVC
jgi:hypothetical protein